MESIINTRQIFLNKMCHIHAHETKIKIYNLNDSKEILFTAWSTQQFPTRIIRETETEIYFQQELSKDGYYGFFDRPDIGHGVIKKKNISLISYFEEVPTVTHPDLKYYKKDDQVMVKVMNWRTQKEEYREGIVTNVHTIYPNHGERHKPYPMVFVSTIFTYHKFDEKGQDTFYDKSNTTGCIQNVDLKFNASKSPVKI